MSEHPKPCPFCGAQPEIFPVDRFRTDRWASVKCTNRDCPAQPEAHDGEEVGDDLSRQAFRDAAIRRWNRRAPAGETRE